MTNTNKELSQIAKQVSLLNRLLELLRMQENDGLQEGFLKDIGWLFRCGGGKPEIPKCFSHDKVRYLSNDGNPTLGLIYSTIEEAWNHPTTQKAWSDELVQVARELVKDLYNVDSLIECLYVTIFGIFTDTPHSAKEQLEAILGKYGRSLSE